MSAVLEVYDFEYDPHTETIYLEAEVEDSVQTRPATFYDPEEWGPGRCKAHIFWPEDFGVPTKTSLLEHLAHDPLIDWEFVGWDSLKTSFERNLNL